MIGNFIDRLKQVIESGLPGAEAHAAMAPATRQVKQFDPADYPDARRAAVMLLFYPVADQVFFVLIKRPAYNGVHSAQVSFPGGGVEKNDTDMAFTALRETEEETGVDRSSITVISSLSNVYIPPSNFFVFPVVGFCDHRPQFFPDKNEVDYLIETPVDILLEEAIKGTVRIDRKDISFDAPCYYIQEEAVWGATAIILSEVEWLVRRVREEEVLRKIE